MPHNEAHTAQSSNSLRSKMLHARGLGGASVLAKPHMLLSFSTLMTVRNKAPPKKRDFGCVLGRKRSQDPAAGKQSHVNLSRPTRNIVLGSAWLDPQTNAENSEKHVVTLLKGSFLVLGTDGLKEHSAKQCVRRKMQLGARTLLGAPGRTTKNKKLLGAKGIATRSKDATRGSWPYY